jgi:hypothetical protein
VLAVAAEKAPSLVAAQLMGDSLWPHGGTKKKQKQGLSKRIKTFQKNVKSKS